MPRPITIKTFLPQREVEICQRFRKVRIESRQQQRELALRLGISRERLASYEYAKAPIRYDFGKRLCRNLNINQRWLATGIGPQKPYFEVGPGFDLNVKNRALFSEVYDEFWKEEVERRWAELEELFDASGLKPGEFQNAISNSSPAVVEHPTTAMALHFASIISTRLHYLPERLKAEYGRILLETDKKFCAKHVGEIKQFLHGLEKNKREQELEVTVGSQVTLDTSAATIDSPDVQALKSVPDLVARLKKLAKKFGSKAALARNLDVSRQAVDQWLNGKTKPSRDIAIKVMNLE